MSRGWRKPLAVSWNGEMDSIFVISASDWWRRKVFPCFSYLVQSSFQVCGFARCSWNLFSFSPLIAVSEKFRLTWTCLLRPRSVILHSRKNDGHRFWPLLLKLYFPPWFRWVSRRHTTIQVGNLIYYEVIVYAASMKVTVSTSQLIMECICGSCFCIIWIGDTQHLILRNPRSALWCDYSCLDEQAISIIKRNQSADVSEVHMKRLELEAIIVCPRIKRSCVVARHNVRPRVNTRVRHANGDAPFSFVNLTCRDASWETWQKTLLIPLEMWDSESAELLYAVFIMVYNALTELYKPTLGLKDGINPTYALLSIRLC